LGPIPNRQDAYKYFKYLNHLLCSGSIIKVNT
jgi:hypothetical protein